MNDLFIGKHRSKSGGEVSLLTSSVLKEHAVLAKKVEELSKEKIEISKQLIAVQRESRDVRKQLDEVMGEKAILIEKLENATSQLRSNTNTKKTALTKIQEYEVRIQAGGGFAKIGSFLGLDCEFEI